MQNQVRLGSNHVSKSTKWQKFYIFTLWNKQVLWPLFYTLNLWNFARHLLSNQSLFVSYVSCAVSPSETTVGAIFWSLSPSLWVFFFFLSFFFGLINYCKHEVLGHCKVPGKCCQSILWKHYTSLFIHHCEAKCLLLCILAHTGYDHVKFANLKGKHALYLDFHFDSY